MIFVTKLFSNIDDLTPSVKEFDFDFHIDMPPTWFVTTLYKANAIAMPTELAIHIWMAFAMINKAFILLKVKFVLNFLHLGIQQGYLSYLQSLSKDLRKMLIQKLNPILLRKRYL